MIEHPPTDDTMPSRAPLAMQIQDFSRPPVRRTTTVQPRSLGWRLAVFGPALIGTGLLMYGLYGWLAGAGMTWLEWALLSMIGATFVWVTLSVSTVGVAIAGLLARQRADERAPDAVRSLDVALLVPVYNEVPWDVFGNATAMLADLHRRAGPHRYTLFILSDTRTRRLSRRKSAPLPSCGPKRPRA